MDLLASLGILLFAWVGVFCFDCSQKEGLSLSDDGYHYPSLHILSDLYSEWWYFTFYSSDENVGGIIEIEIEDPKNRLGNGNSNVKATVFTPQNSFMVTEYYNVTDFVGFTENATVSIPTGSIEVVSDLVYNIKLALNSYPVVFDLVLEKAPKVEGVLQHPGVEPLVYFGYICYMPIGRVTGKMTVEKKEYTFNNDVLFHDHQYGTWFDFLANKCGWGQIGSFDKNFAIVYGFDKILPSKEEDEKLSNIVFAGYLYLRIGELNVSETIGTSCLNSFDIYVNETAEIGGEYKYASVYTLEVKNSLYRVVVSVNVTRTYEEPESSKLSTVRSSAGGDKGVDIVTISYCEAFVYDAKTGKLIIDTSGYGYGVWPSDILKL